MSEETRLTLLKRPTPEEVIRTALSLRCYFCRAHPAPTVFIWRPSEEDVSAFNLKALVMGMPGPEENTARTLIVAFCASCLEPYSGELGEQLLQEKIRTKFFSLEG